MTGYPLTEAVLARLREEAAFSGVTGCWDGGTVGRALTRGGCALFAAALAVTHGLPVVSVGQADCCRTRLRATFGDVAVCCVFGLCAPYGDGRCHCHAHHFHVEVDGWLVDAYGDHDESGILDAYEEVATYLWSDAALACLLETWHCENAEDADLVLLALEVAARPLAEVRAGLAAGLEVAALV